jgi:hypothetical protein
MTHILLLSAMLAAASQSTPVSFSTLVSGDNSQIETARQAEARTAAEWSTLWQEHGGPGKPLAVDFAKEMVVAVFAGTQPSAGYGIEIIRVEAKNGGLLVTYRTRVPKPGEMVAMVLTSPFHIARVPSHAKVTFVRQD